MRSALADRWRLLVAGALVAGSLLSGGCQDDEPYVAPAPTASSDAVEPAAASSTLDRLEAALRRGDVDAAADLGADDAASAHLRTVARNATILDLADLSFSYVTENGRVEPDGTWTATVTATWRIGGFERTPARADVELAFADDGARIAAIGGGPNRSPVWLGGETTVRRTDDVAVLVAGGALPVRPLLAEAEEALVVARRVLGARADRLVVEVPASAAALHAALGLPPGTYDAVAGVTTTADGANVPGTPVHVFLNPEVFGPLDRVAAQVVVSHEAVHAVTDAPESGAEAWLVEGFADYVALRDVDLPFARTAGQIIAQVRDSGVPDALPSRVDLDSQAAHLGAAYESAWLVCVTLAEHGGEEALVAFYDAVLDGADLEQALREHVDWSLTDLTRAWQDKLRTLADARA
ncbi:hypothetical protein DJ010_05325 [Nocardioides silvaticus]|uniref:Peptidase MA-like domain-containing protein n=1 Tax=Nocardioides silvaticus TaxID=2201891 RepID=A0A316TMP4_9ACTN|nr:hypothetical protein [Nocardioides silvaticus]PWN03532.1 hypothetical protein DJ010_05325 [Nocardioides silvaticus]